MGSHLHPTQKPVSLMRWMVERWTEPGDLVLDPYMGSGPIAQACLETRRRYLGIEIDPHYVQTTLNHRLHQPTPNLETTETPLPLQLEVR
jgi:DNA modification methylase